MRIPTRAMTSHKILHEPPDALERWMLAELRWDRVKGALGRTRKAASIAPSGDERRTFNISPTSRMTHPLSVRVT